MLFIKMEFLFDNELQNNEYPLKLFCRWTHNYVSLFGNKWEFKGQIELNYLYLRIFNYKLIIEVL